MERHHIIPIRIVTSALIAALFSQLFISPSPAVADVTADPLVKEYVVDMHVHAAGIGSRSDCRISDELRKNWRYRIYLEAYGTNEKELKQEGDAIIFRRLTEKLAGSKLVDAAIVLAIDAVAVHGKPSPEESEVYIPNDFIRDGTAPYDNLYYGASVNPYRADWEKELERVQADGAVLIKWLPAIQHIVPDDEKIIPFYRKMKELGLPLLVHTGAEKSFSAAHERLGDPKLLELPLKVGVTVIASHVATTGAIEGEEFVDRLLPMLERYDNLYSDISSLTQINKRKYPRRIAARDDLHHKLLYGTDYPLIDTNWGPFNLVSPWYFIGKVPFGKIREIARIENSWDRDLQLKRALGFPDEIFSRPAELLLRRE